MNKRLLLVTVMAIGLTACASAGVKVDPQKVAAFQKGKTTYSEVVEALGRPTTQTNLDNGNRIISYSYFGIQAHPENFIPYIGAFVGGSDTETTMVSMTFDRKDILRSVTSSQTGMGSGRGFEAVSQERKDTREVK